MQVDNTHGWQTLGAGLMIVGGALTILSIISWIAAAEHMAAASLCGPLTRHCILCVMSGGSLLSSFGVIAVGMVLRRCDPYPDQPAPSFV